mgnify:FL=1
MPGENPRHNMKKGKGSLTDLASKPSDDAPSSTNTEEHKPDDRKSGELGRFASPGLDEKCLERIDDTAADTTKKTGEGISNSLNNLRNHDIPPFRNIERL